MKSERETRKEIIDKKLLQAGWKVDDRTQVVEEFDVDAWMDIFGIQERYKATCLAKNNGKVWYSEAVDGYESAKAILETDFSKEKWVQRCVAAAQSDPFANGNLIKAAFLEGCKRANIL